MPVRGTTFEEAARAWHANRPSSLEPSHAERLMTRLERDAFPPLGAKQLQEITSSDVLAMIRDVEARGALDVSRRLKQHVSQIYRFAIPQGWAEQDPAAYITDLLKPKPRVRHMPRLGVRELPELVRAIDQYDGEENPAGGRLHVLRCSSPCWPGRAPTRRASRHGTSLRGWIHVSRSGGYRASA